MRRERDRLKQREAQLQDEISAERLAREVVERREARLKKRVSRGVCPCCQRTVAQMARHMKMQHPEYMADNIVKLDAQKASA